MPARTPARAAWKAALRAQPGPQRSGTGDPVDRSLTVAAPRRGHGSNGAATVRERLAGGNEVTGTVDCIPASPGGLQEAGGGARQVFASGGGAFAHHHYPEAAGFEAGYLLPTAAERAQGLGAAALRG